MDTVGGEGEAARDPRNGLSGEPSSEAFRYRRDAPAWVTLVLIFVNVVVFGLMATAFNAVNGFNVLQLAAWGGNSGTLDLSGQWWRLVTYQFLHVNLLHVVTNMLVLWTVGRLTERLYGSAPLLGLYLAAGVIAGLISVVWNPYQVIVGASGPIFGIVGAFIVFLLRRRNAIPKSLLLYLPIAVLFAGVNLYLGAFNPAVDNAAHFGGLLAGFALGAVMTGKTDSRQRVSVQGAIIAVVVFVGLALPPLWYLGAFDHRRTVAQEFVATHEWYMRKETSNLLLWQSLASQVASGAISNDEVGRRFKNEILPFWADASVRLRSEAAAARGQNNTYVTAAADFARARLDWAKAVIASANDPTGSEAQLAPADIQETNLAQARLYRLEMRSEAESLPRPLAHSAFVARLMALIPTTASQCVRSRYYRNETAMRDAGNDGPALRRNIGCEAQNMFLRGDYANLDATMGRYSRALSDLPDGGSRLEGLWNGLDDLFESNRLTANEVMERTAEWRRSVPSSSEPDVVEALMFRDWAYAARGNGDISTVSQQAQVLFVMRSEMAAEDLREIAPAGRNNPLWYQLSLAVGRDQSVSIDDLRAIFDKGAARFPDYMPLYRQMLTTLMPRWEGTTADVDAFIVDVAKKAGRGQIDPAMYARLYLIDAYLEGDDFDVVDQAPANMMTMKAGVQSLLRLHPLSDYMLNEAAHYYCSINDIMDFRVLRPRLINHVSSSAWPDKLSIATCAARDRS
jgi:membrane associated rhomboid family serine protease